MNKCKVGIIILNYNDCNNTIRFVNEIQEYNVIDKIVIVDNNSTKENEFEKLYKLSSEKIDVIKSDKNGGYSYGNNYGIKYLEKILPDVTYVIISNPDISVKEEAIIKCIKFLQQNLNVAIVAPRMHYISGPARRSAWKDRTFLVDIANSTRVTQFFLFYFFKFGEYKKSDFNKNELQVENISGAFFIADMKKFREVGFFDEKVFLFYEEDIISHKLREKGYYIYSLNDISFMHYDSQTIGKIMNMFKKQDILFNSRIYYQKYYNKVNKIQVFLFRILRYLRKFELIFEVPLRKIFNSK